MKRLAIAIVLGLFFLLSNGFHAIAAVPAWEFDKAHSRFGFGVKHIFSTIHGYFDNYSGTFLFDPDNLKESKIVFEIEAKSIQTTINKRDNHLRSADFFDVKNYPLIKFESTSIKKGSGKLYEVTGKLTMKDVTQNIVLPMMFQGVQVHPMEKKKLVAGFDIGLTINRLEYKVGDGRFYEMGVVDRDVTIDVSLEMLRNK